MLVAGPSGHECETKIGDRAAGEYTDMLPLLEMGQYETLPVDGQRIGGAVGSELKTATTRERLQQKMHLGIVSKRLEMAHTLDRSCNRFLVQDATGRKSNLDTIAFLHHTLQDLGLDLTHEMNVNLLLRTVPADMELREFVGERLQLPIELQRIHIFGYELIVQHRAQTRVTSCRLTAEAVAGLQSRKIRDRHDRSGFRRIRSGILHTAVEPKLRHLLARQKLGTHLQLATGNLHIGKAMALRIPSDLKHAGPEARRIERNFDQLVHPLEQCLHAIALQGRTEKYRKELPVEDHVPYILRLEDTGFEEALHAVLVTHGDIFLQRVGHRIATGLAEINEAHTEVLFQIRHQGRLLRPRLIHLVYEHETRNMVAFQQTP